MRSLPDAGSTPRVRWAAIDARQPGKPNPMFSPVASERTAASDLFSSTESSLGIRLLTGALSMIAGGSVDVTAKPPSRI